MKHRLSSRGNVVALATVALATVAHATILADNRGKCNIKKTV
jgi:hypothetical protein